MTGHAACLSLKHTVPRLDTSATHERRPRAACVSLVGGGYESEAVRVAVVGLSRTSMFNRVPSFRRTPASLSPEG